MTFNLGTCLGRPVGSLQIQDILGSVFYVPTVCDVDLFLLWVTYMGVASPIRGIRVDNSLNTFKCSVATNIFTESEEI